MSSTYPVLQAEPADPTLNAGPRHRVGFGARFIAITMGLVLLAGTLMLFQAKQDLWAWVGVMVFAGFAIFFFGAASVYRRQCDDLPASHTVLAGVLGFDIHCTCRDVAATVFFQPDTAISGTPLRLLCFVENYASRERVAAFRIGPHPELGLAEAKEVRLHLAAGQAAVYALPLRIAGTLPIGEHDLPVSLCVSCPSGTGAPLSGARRHAYDLWTLRFAAPFTVAKTSAAHAYAPEEFDSQTESARYLTLASASEPEPHCERLESLFVESVI